MVQISTKKLIDKNTAHDRLSFFHFCKNLANRSKAVAKMTAAKTSNNIWRICQRI
jgi:hypothetical protein